MTTTTTTTATTDMQRISIDLIQAGNRIRTVNRAQVNALMASIAEVGLLNPITVYRCANTRGGDQVDGFGLIAGAHRVTACRDLGHTEVAAIIVEMDEPRRIIAECDENLCVSELSPTERAEFTQRRKWAWEELHPETKHGANQHTRSGQVCNSSFADETAAATGKSARAVSRDAERGAKVAQSVLTMLKGTKLDTGVYLDELKGLSPDEQEQRVRELLEDEQRTRAAAARAKAAIKGNLRRKGNKQKNSHPGPNRIADRPSHFASLVEELAGFTRAEFQEWRTLDRGHQETVTKARAYAPSAVAMVRHFLEIHAEPKAWQ